MVLNPLTLLREASRAVPAVKYALGVAGIVSVVAITKTFGLNPYMAVFGSIVTLVLMVVLLIFARLTTTASQYFIMPVLVFMWGSLGLVLATANLLFSSAFFHWPRPMDFYPIPQPVLPTQPAVDVSAVSKVVQSQLDSHDYAGAWDTVTQALQGQAAPAPLLDLQTNVAEAWLQDVHLPENQRFADVVDKLLPALYKTAERSKGSKAADALAHIGWGNFLKSRDGISNLDIEGKYRGALQLDPDNPFAHAMWGHWLIANGNHLAEAREHFAAAVKSGREGPFVRRFQLAALQWVRTGENAIELIRVCNQMRQNNESLPLETRSRLLSGIYSMNRDEILAKLDQILPADEHLSTFRWLAQGIDVTQSGDQAFILARLTEAAGDCATAQHLYVSLLAASALSQQVHDGLERCKHKSPQAKSEIDILTESLHDKSASVRRSAVDGLAALNNSAKIDPKLLAPALHDSDSEVHNAAVGALTRFGGRVVPAMIDLLGSSEPAEQAGAAEVLGKMGAESKAAVPALVKVLTGSDQEAKGAALEALANLGPDAGPAVAPIIKMLGAGPNLNDRKALIYALGEIGPASKPAVPLIVEALRDQSDPEGFLNVVAADALGKIGPGSAAAVPDLVTALGSDDVRLPTRATEALGRIGAEAKTAIPALVEAMQREEPEHKENQAEAIGQIAQSLAIRRDRGSLKVLRTAFRAEGDAGLGIAAVAPLREAIDDLESAGKSKHPANH